MPERLRRVEASSDYDAFNNRSLFEIDSPEKRLLCAILKRAIEDCLLPERQIINKLNLSAINHVRRQAEGWVKDSYNQDIGSIRWLLEYISNHPAVAHKEILKMLKDSKSRQRMIDNCFTHRVYSIRRVSRQRE